MDKRRLFLIGIIAVITLLIGCGAAGPKLEVVNQLGTEICGITTYDEPKNLLDGEAIFAGNSIKLDMTAGDQDVFLVNCDASNAIIAVRSFAFEESGTTTWTVSSEDPMLKLTNSMGVDLCSLQLKDHDANDWGPNWIQNTGMAADWTVSMIVPAAGSYDLFATSCDDGTGFEEYQIEVGGGAPTELELIAD